MYVCIMRQCFGVGTSYGSWLVLTNLASRLNRIDRILIPPRYTFFSGSPTEKNSRVKRAWPGAILGWVTNWEVFSGAAS
jgi:hypothetical protein